MDRSLIWADEKKKLFLCRADDPAAVTNKGAIYQDSFKLPAGSVAPLVASSGGVRKVDLTVCVYKKGKGGNNPDKEKYRYITVSTSKGE